MKTLKKETIITAVLNDVEIKFKIVVYQDGKLECEPITTKYAVIGLHHLFFPERVTKWDEEGEAKRGNPQ